MRFQAELVVSVAFALLTGVACGGSKTVKDDGLANRGDSDVVGNTATEGRIPAENTSADFPVTELEQLADESCACADKPCTQEVESRAAAVKERLAGADRPAAEVEQIQAAEAKMSSCSARLSIVDDPVADLEMIRDEVCACKDPACAETAMEKMQKLAEKYKDTKAPSADQMKKIQASTSTMMGCMVKIMSPEPSNDPND